MIVFRYSKTGGGEFVSHLDTLRHLNKTFLRADIKVKQSQGFHPHMLVYMSSPVGVGLKSYAEYCAVEADLSPEQFKELFNAHAPKFIRCMEAYSADKNPNLASVINRAIYFFEGLPEFDESEILNAKEYFVTDKRGNEKEVRAKIFDIKKADGGYIAMLAAGNDCLRPDVFAESILKRCGEAPVSITKLESFAGEKRIEEIL